MTAVDWGGDIITYITSASASARRGASGGARTVEQACVDGEPAEDEQDEPAAREEPAGAGLGAVLGRRLDLPQQPPDAFFVHAIFLVSGRGVENGRGGLRQQIKTRSAEPDWACFSYCTRQTGRTEKRHSSLALGKVKRD